SLKAKVVAGSLDAIRAGSGKVAIGSRLAENLGATLGQTLTVINPSGRSTPFGTMPRQIPYEIGAIFEIGIYDYDKAFIIMPMEDAQTLLLLGDKVGMVEVQTSDPDRIGEFMAPLAKAVEGRAIVIDWRQMNASLFEALQVDRVVSFV